MRQSQRTVGYCTNADCSHHHKGVLLPNRGAAFICPRCQRRGCVEWERGVINGDSNIFSEVRVEYDFDPTAGCYRGIARVRDAGVLREHNTYTLQTPFIRSQGFALRAAETILKQLNR